MIEGAKVNYNELTRMFEVDFYRESIVDFIDNSFLRLKAFVDLLAGYDCDDVRQIGFMAQELVKTEMKRARQPLDFLRDNYGDFMVIYSRDYRQDQKIEQDDILCLLFEGCDQDPELDAGMLITRSAQGGAHHGETGNMVPGRSSGDLGKSAKISGDALKMIMRCEFYWEEIDEYIRERYRRLEILADLLANQDGYEIQKLGFLAQTLIKLEIKKSLHVLHFLRDNYGQFVVISAREDVVERKIMEGDILCLGFKPYNDHDQDFNSWIPIERKAVKNNGCKVLKQRMAINLETFKHSFGNIIQ